MNKETHQPITATAAEEKASLLISQAYEILYKSVLSRHIRQEILERKQKGVRNG
jgi:hypothetical protein